MKFNMAVSRKTIGWAAVVFVTAFLAVCVFLAGDYRRMRGGTPVTRESWADLLRRHGPLSASDAGMVEPWMTFDYINHIFALPPSCLRDALSVTESGYPRISLMRFAKSRGISSAVAAEEVRDAVRTCFGNTP